MFRLRSYFYCNNIVCYNLPAVGKRNPYLREILVMVIVLVMPLIISTTMMLCIDEVHNIITN